MTSIREMYQMGKDLVEIAARGDDFRKFYKGRSTLELTTSISADDKITNHIKIPMKSHTKGLMALIYSQQTARDFVGVDDLIGTNRTVIVDEFNVQTSANTNVEGIIVGSSATATKTTDNELNTKIPHGSTPGTQELVYSATTISALTNSSAGVWSFTMSREFQNDQGLDAGGGISVTVREIGFYVRHNSVTFLGEHSLTGSLPVDNDDGDPDNNKEKLTVVYTEKVTV